MANIVLSTDLRGHPIQALSPVENVSLPIGASSNRVALPPDSEIVRLAASVDCFFRFGNSTVTTDGTGNIFTKGVEVFRVPPDATHICTIQMTSGGVMSISKMQ